MTKIDAIARIQSSLPKLSAEQAEMLAELAAAWAEERPSEDDATRAAIGEGVAQAERGEFVEKSRVDALLQRRWQ